MRGYSLCRCASSTLQQPLRSEAFLFAAGGTTISRFIRGTPGRETRRKWTVPQLTPRDGGQNFVKRRFRSKVPDTYTRAIDSHADAA